MSSTITNEYNPTQVSHPGITLAEVLNEIGMTQKDLASRMGRPPKTINEIINGKTSVLSDTALQLETVLGIPASFWLKRQNDYDEAAARARQSDQLLQFLEWGQRFPLRDMCNKFGLCTSREKTERVKELLTFFGFVSPSQWDAYWSSLIVDFRQSEAFKAETESLSVWLRLGELKAQQLSCEDYDKKSFTSALNEIRTYTTKDPEHFEPKMKELCAQSGVAYVLVPELPKTRVSGATRWLSQKRALIQQSLRYRTNDQFWFTFFHEAAHVLIHGRDDIILEFNGNRDKREQEANRFAADFLIPPDAYSEFVTEGIFTKATVQQFATSIDISPAIVVGRLQRERLLRYDYLNGFKVQFAWKSTVTPLESK